MSGEALESTAGGCGRCDGGGLVGGDVWMVKVEGYKEWPFMTFLTEEAAVECALSMHPGREDLGDIVRRAPLCDRFFMAERCWR